MQSELDLTIKVMKITNAVQGRHGWQQLVKKRLKWYMIGIRSGDDGVIRHSVFECICYVLDLKFEAWSLRRCVSRVGMDVEAIKIQGKILRLSVSPDQVHCYDSDWFEFRHSSGVVILVQLYILGSALVYICIMSLYSRGVDFARGKILWGTAEKRF